MPRVLKPACFRKFEAIPTLFPWTYRLKPKPQTLKPVCFPRVWSYSDPLTLSADSKTESSHLKTCLLQKVWCYSDPSTSVAVPLYGWLSSELFFPCCIGMLFSYNYRPYEISIIIGIVAPILHRDAVFIQLSTVRNVDYHRNCCSHAAWGFSFYTSVYRTKFRLSSELFLSCWMGVFFFLQVPTVRNFDYHRNCCSHAAWGFFFLQVPTVRNFDYHRNCCSHPIFK